MVHSLSFALIVCALATAIAVESATADVPSPFGNPSVKEDAPNSFQKELEVYYTCNAKHARTVAGQEGDPVSLGIAVRGMCHREEANLGQILARSRGPQRAQGLLNEARKVVLERNAALIVNERITPAALRACEDSNDVEHAIRACTELISLYPKDINAYISRAISFHKQGNHDRAVADYTKAIEIKPSEALFYQLRGIANGDKGDNDRAIADYTKAIEINPKYAQAYEFRGVIFFGKTNYDQAIADLTQAIQLDRIDELIFTARGNSFFAKGDHARAISDYTKAIEINPQYMNAYSMRAIALDKIGEKDRAIDDNRTILRLPATSEENLKTQAEARYTLKLDEFKRRRDKGESMEEAIRVFTDPSAPAPSPEARRPVSVPRGKTSGTGVLVSRDGDLLTNAHVVKNCERVEINKVGTAPSVARVLASDQASDLALLKASIPVSTPPAFRKDPRVGENVFAFGFPLAGILASSGNFTSGSITANAGIEDDATKLQISAPVQPGNSGGPLLDQFGNIVGIVVSKLDALKYAEATKDLTQNVNFAIKSVVAIDFLKAHGVTVITAAESQSLDPADVAERAIAASVYIVCK